MRTVLFLLWLMSLAMVFAITPTVVIAQNQYHIDSLEKSLRDFEEQKKKADTTASLADSIKANILIGLGAEWFDNDPEKAKGYADQVLKLSQEIGYKKGVGNAWNGIAIYYLQTGNYDTALECLQKSLTIKSGLGDEKGVANVYNNIGTIYFNQANYPDALKNFLISLKIKEDVGYKKGIAHAMINISSIYATMRNYSAALEMAKKALGVDEEANDTVDIAHDHSTIANIYYAMNSDDLALEHYNTALLLVEKIGNRTEVARISTNIGDVYKANNQYEEALKYYLQALDIFKKVNNKGGLANANILAGSIYEIFNQPEVALKYVTEGLAYAKELNLVDKMSNAYQILSVLYQKTGKYKEAYEYAVLYKTTYDSLFNADNERHVTQMSMQYEFDKKEAAAKAEQEKKDIVIKAQKNRLIISIISFVIILSLGGTIFYINRKRKETLYKQNLSESEMKALRAQMNPHFMFNSLNAIQQMVMNNENENAFKYLDNYSKLTRKILENSEKKWISLQDEIKFLELYLQIESLRFEHAFTYEIKTGENISVHEDKIPAMIIQPLVENAIKHGLLNKEGEKKLLISFNKPGNNGQLEVVVEDNGVGREAAGSLKHGTDHQSMSISITENRLRLIDKGGDSKIVIEDLKEDGDAKTSGTRVKVLITQPD